MERDLVGVGAAGVVAGQDGAELHEPPGVEPGGDGVAHLVGLGDGDRAVVHHHQVGRGERRGVHLTVARPRWRADGGDVQPGAEVYGAQERLGGRGHRDDRVGGRRHRGGGVGDTGPQPEVALNAELGFDRPVIAQFGDYLGGLLRGDFQNSYRETGTSSMAATAAAATQRGVMVRLHCLQSPREDGLLRERYGIGVVDALERTGLLDASLLIPHGSQLGDLRDPAVVAGPDVQRLVAVGVPIIHCPLTSARYGGGLRSFEAYRAAGLRMVLGSDSFPPDLLRGIDVGVQVAKILGGAWRRGGWRATCAPPPATPPTPSVDPTWVGSRSGRAPIS